MTLAIPASEIVAVNAGVINAGGAGLDLIGLMLTTSTQVPIGQVISFGSAAVVAAYFGGSSTEALDAAVYFQGYDNSAIKPGALLVAQYPPLQVPAYVRGGNIGLLTLAQLQALTPATLTIVINGLSHTSGSINLSSATSFSNAASIIQTALNANDATFTGAIAASTASVTGSIAGTTLTVTVVGSGVLVDGGILSGSGVTAGTQIGAQLTGAAGGIGTYQVNISQTVASTAISETYGTLTVSAISAGVLAFGQNIVGAGVTVGTAITQFLSGTGGAGTYAVSPSQVISSEAMSAGAAIVSYDSVSGGFVITGGTRGPSSTIAYPSGAMATSLLLTQTLGAVISQGASAGSPVTFMNAVIQQTQNWFSFWTTFDPSFNDKVAFATWTNTNSPDYAYVEWAQDAANTLPSPSTATAAIIAAGYSGTFPIYAPSQTHQQAAMVSGFFASIDFTQFNGRTTLDFRAESGQLPEVTNQLIADQLRLNGLNFYGTWSTRSQGFTFLDNGQITGKFSWADTYADAAWLKAALQQAGMTLLTSLPSIPYNSAGYALIEAALLEPINAALFFGAIRPGVPLSSLQAAEVNNAAGINISTTIVNRGWYLLIQPASPQVRAQRLSPPITLFYSDGESVQRLVLQSLVIQ